MLGAGKDIRIAGKISFIGNDPDMWVDYGGKFDAYVPSPSMEHQLERWGKPLQKGDLVQIILHETEICAHFLGADAPVSMREGKGTFLGILPQKILKSSK